MRSIAKCGWKEKDMRTTEKYCCDEIEEECEAHEAKRCTDVGKTDNKPIVEDLRYISDTAYNYRFDETVFISYQI